MNDQIEFIKHNIQLSENGSSKLTEEILGLEGMSGRKFRHLLNNIIKADTRYLEIGSWKGSTLISALYKNSLDYYVAIDNFSQYGSPKTEFFENCEKYLGYTPNFIDKDSFQINPIDHGITNIDLYFYDGCHSTESHEKAITHYYSSLANQFILIIDDWNWEGVRSGTYNGLKNKNVSILNCSEIFTERNGVSDGWWNGVAIFVCRK